MADRNILAVDCVVADVVETVAGIIHGKFTGRAEGHAQQVANSVVVLGAVQPARGDAARIFGGSNPAAVMYTKGDFIAKNPVTTQLLANAFYKALKWLEAATPEQIADAVPVEYHLNDKPLYLRAVASSKESWSRTGVVPREGMESVFAMLKALESEMADAKVDLGATFDGNFIAKAR